jgi:pimeloyl-ACP methyl ester carboxylesterase
MGFILFLIVVTVFLFFPLSTYILFWYETANSAYKDELTRISNGRPAGWILRGIVSSVLSHIVAIGCYPLGLVRSLWRPAPGVSASSPPVILIHGLYHNASAWIRFRGSLRRAGYERFYAFDYNSFRPDFQQISRQLEQWITDISRNFPEEGIILVGHSMGGLLARAYAARDDLSQGPPVKGLVTLGTPYGGSKAVVFGIGHLAKSLACGSPLIQQLEEKQIPSEIPCIAFHSPVDNLVLPAESLKPPSGCREELTDPVCHVAMLYHGPTIRRVVEQMKTAVVPPEA